MVDLGEELSRRNGSAVLTVARSLSSAANRAGQDSLIGGGRGTIRDLKGCVEVVQRTDKRSRLITALDFAARGLKGEGLIPREVVIPGPKPETVFLHNRPWDAELFRAAFPDSRIVLYLHNLTMRRALPSAMRHALDKFDHVITVSEFVRHELLNRSKWEATGHVTSVLNAPPGHSYAASVEPRTDVLYVGRLTPEKGGHVLLEALEELDEVVNVTFVGGHFFLPGQTLSRYEQRLRQRAARLTHSVRFTGPLPPSEIRTHMAASRIVVVPSLWDDPCPLVLYEAMESPAAVVAAAVGGMVEQGARGGVEFFPRGDSSALAVTLTNLLSDSIRRADLAAAGTASASARTWDDVFFEVQAAAGG